MTPRPILKTHCPESGFPSPTSALPFRVLHSPHVHFPPTPTLTDTQSTHSPVAYDRAPIIVSPNRCALPERGGRVYSSFSASSLASPGPKGSYFHPRAYEAHSPESLNFPKDCFGPGVPSSPDSNDTGSSISPSSCAPPMMNSPVEAGHCQYLLYPPPTTGPGGSVSSPGAVPLAFPLDMGQVRMRRAGSKKTRKKSRLAFEQPGGCQWENEMSPNDGCLGGF